MANPFPSIVPRFHRRFSAAAFMLLLLANTCRLVAQTTAPVQPLAGPATLELERGRIWLNVPAGYVYVSNPDDIRKVDEAAGRSYDATQLAIVAPAAADKEFIIQTDGAVDESEWEGAPGTEWKERILTKLKTLMEAPSDPASSQPSGSKVLGWYSAPTYTAGRWRYMQLPLLMQPPTGEPTVLTIGVVGMPDREISMICHVHTEAQAGAVSQMNELMDSIRFEPPPPPPPPPPKPSSGNVPASGKDSVEKIFGNSVVAKVVITIVGGVFAAIFSGAKSIYRMFRPFKGTDDAEDATAQSPVGLQTQPPPPPAEGEFPET